MGGCGRTEKYPSKFCRTREIIFTGLKPDRGNPEKSGPVWV